MNASSVKTIYSLVPATFLICYGIIQWPQGSWGQIYIVLALIGAGGLWFLFHGSTVNRLSAGIIGALAFFGALGVGASGSMNDLALSNLNDVIPAYEKQMDSIEERSNHPGLKEGQSIWTLRTADKISNVRGFYRDLRNHGDWKLVGEDKKFVFKRGKDTLFIEPSSSSGMTEVRYEQHLASKAE